MSKVKEIKLKKLKEVTITNKSIKAFKKDKLEKRCKVNDKN